MTAPEDRLRRFGRAVDGEVTRDAPARTSTCVFGDTRVELDGETVTLTRDTENGTLTVESSIWDVSVEDGEIRFWNPRSEVRVPIE